VIEAIKQFVQEQGAALSENFKIFISSGIGHYAPQITNKGNLIAVDAEQLKKLETIPAENLVPYNAGEAASNGIGYLDALAATSREDLQTILQKAFGSVFRSQTA